MNNTLNISELKAQVLAAQEANKAKIAEAAEIAKLQASLANESSPELFDAKVKLAVTAGYTEKLQRIVNECEEIVNSMPITNTKSRSLRKWAGNKRFAYGTHINLMTQIASGILYSCAEHKELMIAHTGLDLELLEQFLKAFGSPAYYNRNENALVEAKMYNVENALETTKLLQSELDVDADVKLVTEETFSAEFGRAETTANKDLIAATEAIEKADFAI